MSAVVAALVPVVVLLAVVLAAAVLAATRSARTALPVLLDLLLVAGLLRLSATGTWEAIGSAALVVVVRKVATYGIGLAGRDHVHMVGRASRMSDGS